jgi:hypothetical protein
MPLLTPANIDAFMDDNIVKTPTDISNSDIPYADAANKLVWARLQSAAPSVLINPKAGGQVWYIDFMDAGAAAHDPEAFLIYWVEYEANGAGTATWLGNDSPMMFTALMSGCSFGLGSATLAGVRAAHVNSMAVSATGLPDTAQKQDQHQKLVTLNVTARVVTMDEYMPGAFDTAVKTTPFGYRPQLTGGRMPSGRGTVDTPSMSLPWKFYWQKYRQQGKNHTLLSVTQHAGGIF